MSSRILLVEDDPSIVLGLTVNLEAEGYSVTSAGDGARGLALAREGYDLIILDLMIPEINGFEVLQTLRSNGDRTPVLVLSALSLEIDKVTGLDLGAEDYVTKPFALGELLARIRSILRRSERAAESESWSIGELVVDPDRHEARCGDELIDLTPTEFKVLTLLYQAQEKVLSRADILEAAWGPNHHGTERTVDNFVAQLRAKLEPDPANPKHLLTVRGVGYRLAR